ncbi:MAG: F0F1 ATP synthase subunit epsilon [Dehalococcoidia bacterium]|nr:F0F1 ATP synthase subunit epsilon [Dehalococcoidia bacterium]
MVTMLLEIVTAEREVYSDDVEAVNAPGVEGDLGILPHHAPLMTSLQPGELMIRKDGRDEYLMVSGGFLEVMGNRVTILADACERSDEIDEQRAQEAMGRAQERIANRTADLDLEQAASAFRRAETRLRIARRRRTRAAPPPGA